MRLDRLVALIAVILLPAAARAVQVEHAFGAEHVVFDPASRVLVTSSRGGLKLWDARTAEGRGEVGFPRGQDMFGETKQVSFLGDDLVTASSAGVAVVSARDAKLVRELPVSNAEAVAASRDGKRIAVLADGLRVLSPDGAPLWTAAAPRGSWRLGFSPDGKLLAAWGGAAIALFDAATGSPLRTLACEGRDCTVAGAFSPDGQRFASGGRDGTLRIWSVADGQRLKTFDRPEGIPVALAFSADGSEVAGVYGKALVVVRVDNGKERALPTATKEYRDLAWSGDGKTIAVASHDRTIRGLDASTLAQLYSISPEGVQRSSAAPPPASPPVARTEPPPPRAAEPGRGQLVVQVGHPLMVRGVAFSPDNQRLASAGEDGGVVIWDLATGMQLYALHGHTKKVEVVAWSRDGRRLASGAEDGTVRLWDTATGAEVRVLRRHQAMVTGVGFAGDELVSVSSFDSKLRRWSPEGEERSELSLSFPPSGLALSPDGKRAAVYTAVDGRAALIDLAANTVALELQAPVLEGETDALHSKRGLNGLAFAPRGGGVAGLRRDGRVLIWDGQTGVLRRSFAVPCEFALGIAWAPDGRTLAVTTVGAPSVLLYSADGERLAALDTAAESGAVAFSPDGKLVAARLPEPQIRVFDVATRRPAADLGSRAAAVSALAVGVKRPIVATTSVSGEVHVVDLASARDLARFDHPGSWLERKALALSPDGRTLGLAGKEGIELREAATGKVVRKIAARDLGIVERLAFSPDGALLAAGTGRRSIALYEAATGVRRALVQGLSGSVTALAFSPDGSFVAAGDDDVGRLNVHVYGVRDGKRRTLGEEFTSPAQALAFDSSGTRLAVGGLSGETTLWDFASGKKLWRVRDTTGWVNAIAFSSDGSRIFGGSGAGDLLAWDAADGKLLDRQLAHPGGVRAMAPLAGGRLMASAGWDGSTRISDGASLAEVARLVSARGAESLLYLPDGSYLSSRTALRAIAFRAGGRAYPFEQFDLKLNRPDAVVEKLGLSDPSLAAAFRKARARRLARAGFTEAMLGDDVELPEVSIGGPAAGTTDVKSILLGVKASDAHHALRRLHLWVNDVPVLGSAGKDVSARATRTLEEELPLELSAGRNKIQVSAVNDQGVESLRATLELTSRAPARPRLWVVAIGVSRYRDPDYRLRYAAKDAQDVAQLFSSAKGRFIEVKQLLLQDDRATREQIAEARTWLGGSTVDDLAVVFAAGHGVLDAQRDYFFGTSDIDFADPARRGLPYDQLEGLLDGIPARQKLLLIDTCHSGEVEKDDVVVLAGARTGGATVRPVGSRGVARVGSLGLSESLRFAENFFADLRRGTGAVVISAAGGAEYAMERSDLKNGAFTFAVLQGLRTREADRDKDGDVSVSELRDYVLPLVETLTAGGQRPTARRENLTLDFVVY